MFYSAALTAEQTDAMYTSGVLNTAGGHPLYCAPGCPTSKVYFNLQYVYYWSICRNPCIYEESPLVFAILGTYPGWG